MLRITASTRRVATGGWIHRGAVVRGASTFQQLQVEQRDGGKTETSSALEGAPQKVSLPAEETKKLGAALVSVGGVSSSRPLLASPVTCAYYFVAASCSLQYAAVVESEPRSGSPAIRKS